MTSARPPAPTTRQERKLASLHWSPMRRPTTMISAFVVAAVATATVATADDWVVKSAEGNALLLDRTNWTTLETGDYVRSPFTARVLGRGSLNVATSDASVAVRSDTTVTVTSEGTSIRIEVLAGAAAAYAEPNRHVILSSGEVEADLSSGSAELHVAPRGTGVLSRDAAVTVRSGGRDNVQLNGGDSTSIVVPEPVERSSGSEERRDASGNSSSGAADTVSGGMSAVGDGNAGRGGGRP